MYLYSIIFYEFKKEIIEIEYEMYIRNTCLKIVSNWTNYYQYEKLHFEDFDLKNESWRLFDIDKEW